MNELDLIEELIHILKLDSEVARYFQTNIHWLEERRAYWHKSHIRLGLVGVTSSGKSTFLNAVLGKALLPAAVRPSSGILITCAKGEKEEATVHFESRASVKLSSMRLASDLEAYADELFNPGNRKQVTSIDLRSPHYGIDESIKIIDSPGLDAYGLERHEALTMETLLPNVDVCLYMVTLKANSDESTYRIVKSIHEHGKPLIIIQNMLDSVESNKGVNGVVLKSKADVALDHKKRLQRIVDKVSPELARKVQIVQVSAKQALTAKINAYPALYQESRFDLLIQSIQEQVDRLKPTFRSDRLRHVKHHLDELLWMEMAEGAALNSKQETNQFDQQLNQLQEEKQKEASMLQKYRYTIGCMKQIVTEIRTLFASTIRDLERLDKEEVAEAQQLLEKLMERTESSEGRVIEHIRNFEAVLIVRCQSLNLNPDDYKAEMLTVRKNKSTFKIKKQITQEKKRQKSDGFFSGTARFIGNLFDKDWGYKYVTHDVEIIDFQAMRQQLQKYQANITDPLDTFIAGCEVRVRKFFDIFDQELRRREEELKAKKSSVMEKQNIQHVITMLSEAMQRAGSPLDMPNCFKSVNASNVQNSKQQSSSNIKSKVQTRKSDAAKVAKESTKSEAAEEPRVARTLMEIEKPVLSVFHLSDFIAKVHFSTLFAFVQEHNAKLQVFTSTVIWGWDSQSITDFCSRFLYPHVTDKDIAIFCKSGLIYKTVHGHRYLIVNELELDRSLLPQLYKLINNFTFNVYLIVNAMQPGATVTQAKRSLLFIQPAADRAVVNWVSQSFREFKTGGNAEEGLRSLIGISRHFQQPLGMYLINDMNPVYSLFLVELAQLKRITISDEMKLLGKLKATCSLLVGSEEMTICASMAQVYSTVKESSR